MLGEVVYATWQDFLLAAEEATNLDHAVLSLTANRTMAESALNAPRSGWGDEELYKRFPVKAAVLLQRLISNHPLPDGNKRTALLTTIYFAHLNGYDWEPPDADDPDGDETYEVVMGAATTTIPLPALAAWIEDRLILVPPPLPTEAESAPPLIMYPAEWIGQLPYESNTIRIGDFVVRDVHGYNPASIYVRRVSGKVDGMSVGEIIISVVGDASAQEELDAQNEEANRHPLGPKEYWRGQMVGKYTYGADGHVMTDEEFEAEWSESGEGQTLPGTEQTLKEIAAHESGPVAYATAWLDVVLADGNFELSWPLLDQNLRLAWVQGWIYENRNEAQIAEYDRDELAGALSGRGCLGHPLWQIFASAQLGLVQTIFSDWDPSRSGFLSRPRPVGTDYEVVLLAQGEQWRLINVEQPMEVLPFLMHFVHGEGWRVARIGADTPPVPGWPPAFPPNQHLRPVNE